MFVSNLDFQDSRFLVRNQNLSDFSRLNLDIVKIIWIGLIALFGSKNIML